MRLARSLGFCLALAVLSGDVRDGGTTVVDRDSEADTLVLR